MAGRLPKIEEIVEKISRQYKSIKIITKAELFFNGRRIIRDRDGSITVETKENTMQIGRIDLTND